MCHVGPAGGGPWHWHLHLQFPAVDTAGVARLKGLARDHIAGAAGPFTPAMVGAEMSLGLDSTESPGCRWGHLERQAGGTRQGTQMTLVVAHECRYFGGWQVGRA